MPPRSAPWRPGSSGCTLSPRCRSGRLADRYGARLLVGLGLVGSGMMNVLFILFSDHFAPRADRLVRQRGLPGHGVDAPGRRTGPLGKQATARTGGRVVRLLLRGPARRSPSPSVGSSWRGAVWAAVFWAGASVLVPVGIVWWIGVRDPVPRRTAGEREEGSIGMWCGCCHRPLPSGLRTLLSSSGRLPTSSRSTQFR